MSWNEFTASLAPEMLNVGEDAVRDREMCAVDLSFPISFLGPRDKSSYLRPKSDMWMENPCAAQTETLAFSIFLMTAAAQVLQCQLTRTLNYP